MADIKSRLAMFEKNANNPPKAGKLPPATPKKPTAINNTPSSEQRNNTSTIGKKWEQPELSDGKDQNENTILTPKINPKDIISSLNKAAENKKNASINNSSNSEQTFRKSSVTNSSESPALMPGKYFNSLKALKPVGPKPDLKPKSEGLKPKPTSNVPKIALKPTLPSKPDDKLPKPGLNKVDKESTSTSDSRISSKPADEERVDTAIASGIPPLPLRTTSTSSSCSSSPAPSPLTSPRAIQSKPPATPPKPLADESSLKPEEEIQNTEVKIRDKPKVERQSRSVVISRHADNRKFKKISFDSVKPTGAPPKKPSFPVSLDLSALREAYKQYLKCIGGGEQKTEELEQDELYVDGETQVLPRRISTKRESSRISFIPTLTEDEENNLYDDGFTPIYPKSILSLNSNQPAQDDTYLDATSALEEDPDAIYEDEETFLSLPTANDEQEKKRKEKEEQDRQKREEKERKDKEKKDKAIEKQKKKEEDQRRKKLEKLNLTSAQAEDLFVGEGIIKNDAKKNKQNIEVKKGDVVVIMRMDNNPSNKWLIKTDNDIGYVDSSNIEIDPGIIKQTMNGTRKVSSVSSMSQNSALTQDDDQLTYELVGDEARQQASNVQEELEEDDIYQECN